jgi:hypothetical protein
MGNHISIQQQAQFLLVLNSRLATLHDDPEEVLAGEPKECVQLVKEALALIKEQLPDCEEWEFECCVVSDAKQQDVPIVWCNDAFEKLSLYPKELVLGMNLDLFFIFPFHILKLFFFFSFPFPSSLLLIDLFFRKKLSIFTRRIH